MTIGFRERRSSDGWSCDSRRRDCLPEVSSQRTPSPGWKQLAAHLVEVGQRKHSVRARQVLGQASILYLGEAPQLLDHSESMLAAGARPRARPIDHPPALAQRPMGGRTPIDPVTHSPCLEKLAIIFLPVRLIAEHLTLLPMQQLRHLVDVGDTGIGRPHGMDDTALIRSDVQLHSEVPVAALASLLHLGSRLALAFLVELGAAMMVASTMVPERSNSCRSSSRAWIS